MFLVVCVSLGFSRNTKEHDGNPILINISEGNSGTAALRRWEVIIRLGPRYFCSISECLLLSSPQHKPAPLPPSSAPQSSSPGSSRSLFKMQQQLLITETLETWTRIHLSGHTGVVLTRPGCWSYPAVGVNRQFVAVHKQEITSERLKVPQVDSNPGMEPFQRRPREKLKLFICLFPSRPSKRKPSRLSRIFAVWLMEHLE